ncbi:MBL fold metallo-hydrolase [Alkalihalophilus pseudofirmus]|uniref:MBL fold metallo-hydrolase n=1 Tax=Alkalihalophilus pseudofirmus TaxID=79885 RepID=UPI00259B9B41|nr:MBL fold metallo-hydrolase [Alkalihalophilus pseudofirmus]WEG18414.1 MBL fold metallo-hydrolase [Alkalihalophilus pseudofirmus]
MNAPVSLTPSISIIDGFDMSMPERTGSYILNEDKLTIIETGPSPSVKHIIDGFRALDLKLEDVEYIILSHIHLDHAGGAGLLIQHCPNAKVIVHPKGKRHLHDPSRLIMGAKAVYKEDFDRLFDPILPIAEEKLLTVEDGDTLPLSDTCTLTFLHTPGHAAHHISIYESKSKGIFTGDTLGVRYEPLSKDGVELILPSTSPNQFDPEATIQSMKKIQTFGVEQIYFGHYSLAPHPEVVYSHIEKWLPLFVQKGKEAVKDGLGVNELAASILEAVQNELDKKGVERDHPAYEHIRLDLKVCSMGIIDYLSKQT